jgi:manganese transport protein|tara:strand:+ start:19386 stop:21194 length:1809 start_codon:yes stop_codon:yes gene_type:complete
VIKTCPQAATVDRRRRSTRERTTAGDAMSLDDARPGESDVEPVFSRVSAVRSDARDVDGDFHDDHARGGFSGRSGTPTVKTDVGASGDAREGDGDVQILGLDDEDHRFNLKTLWRFMGPGFLMCIAYVDPGNFESDLQAGTLFGYKLLWVLLWATLGGWYIQGLTVRLALATGWDLARCFREEYPDPVRYALWVISELAIIASDVPEVIGTALALKLIFNIPTWVGVVLTSMSTMVFLGLQSFGVRKLEAFMASLVGVMSLCFLAEVTFVDAPASSVVAGVVLPRLPGTKALYIAISLVGAVVMPHNLFLHSALVLSRGFSLGERSLKMAYKYNIVESGLALAVSLFINFAVIIVGAANYAQLTDPVQMQEVRERPLQYAPEMLKQVLGSSAKGFFAAALLASGQSSTITGTYAGQFVMDGFLELRVNPVLRAAVTRMCAILPSLAVVLIAGDSYSESLIVISSTVLAIQLPYALIPLIKFTASPNMMGPMAVPTKQLKFTQCLAGSVIVANVVLIIIIVAESGLVTATFGGVFLALVITATLAAYVVSLLYLARRPVHQNLTNRWSRRMKLDTADDVNLDDTSWNNDELLSDPDRPAVYSL